ncbi:hypothetical protein RRG08_018623 [Elysia crispata]|uniref:Uncharacterized protein n=1 Tax=Elysia crispata TaxID=231223 RepID=A0AAE1BB55_9GAST|nr:hypothetical protein RRG08_018623 [Elysia crispata]
MSQKRLVITLSLRARPPHAELQPRRVIADRITRQRSRGPNTRRGGLYRSGSQLSVDETHAGYRDANDENACEKLAVVYRSVTLSFNHRVNTVRSIVHVVLLLVLTTVLTPSAP